MCLILLAVGMHPDYPLILAANRDEFDRRLARAAHFWDEAPWVLAGKDERSQGTWLGVSTQGKVAMLTNIRDPKAQAGLSRGRLLRRYLLQEESPEAYLAWLRSRAEEFSGFNLIIGTVWELFYLNSRDLDPVHLQSGIHGLSNASLNTAWPKVRQGKEALSRLLSAFRPPLMQDLMSILADRTQPLDGELPDTGVGLAAERFLAPICVQREAYGTQVSTVMKVHSSGHVHFWEKDVRRQGLEPSLRHFELDVPF